MERTSFTPLKGLTFLLALVLLLYPGVLLIQLLAGTLTESLGQIAILLTLSLIAWVWVIRQYRSAEFVGVKMRASE